MDIVQLKYLATIVACDFNLTAAAESLYISQSALSQFIKKFETQERVDLFERRNGRIVALTDAGEAIYQKGLEIIELYESLESTIERASEVKRGLVKIGCHSTFLRLFFTRFIPKFMLDHPEVYIEIVEAGTLELRKMLKEGTINAAILTAPTDLSDLDFEQYPLMKTEVVAFMDPKHPLSHRSYLSWEDLETYPYVTYTNHYMLHQLLQKKLSAKAKERLLFTSGSWDYMIECVLSSELMAILPTTQFKMFQSRMHHIGVLEKRFEEPIPYVSMLVRPKKESYSKVEEMIFSSIANNFYDKEHQLKYNFFNEN